MAKKNGKQNKSIGSHHFQHLWIMNIIFKPSPNQSRCEISSLRSNLFTIMGKKIPWTQRCIIKWLRVCMQCQSCLQKENDLFPEPPLLRHENEAELAVTLNQLADLEFFRFVYFCFMHISLPTCMSVDHVYVMSLEAWNCSYSQLWTCARNWTQVLWKSSQRL